MCDGMKGKFFMFSGNAVTYISSQQKEISNIELPGVNWDGVLICLRIPNQIPPKFDYINYTE